MIEKERKFILLYMPETQEVLDIKQGYLMVDGNRNLRVRIINDSRAYITFKIISSAEEKIEYEYEIPLTNGEDLLRNSKTKLEKRRYKTTFNGNVVDIDIYPDGLSVVEIEYKDKLSILPDYCGKEITGVKEFSNIEKANVSGRSEQYLKDEKVVLPQPDVKCLVCPTCNSTDKYVKFYDENNKCLNCGTDLGQTCI